MFINTIKAKDLHWKFMPPYLKLIASKDSLFPMVPCNSSFLNTAPPVLWFCVVEHAFSHRLLLSFTSSVLLPPVLIFNLVPAFFSHLASGPHFLFTFLLPRPYSCSTFQLSASQCSKFLHFIPWQHTFLVLAFYRKFFLSVLKSYLRCRNASENTGCFSEQ